MAVQLPVPSASYGEIEVSLSGETYLLSYRFNSKFKKNETDEGTWILDILNSDREYIIKGLGIVEQTSLLTGLILEGFPNGQIFCIRNKKTESLPTRNNLGIDKDYVLLYLTNQELANALN